MFNVRLTDVALGATLIWCACAALANTLRPVDQAAAFLGTCVGEIVS